MGFFGFGGRREQEHVCYSKGHGGYASLGDLVMVPPGVLVRDGANAYMGYVDDYEVDSDEVVLLVRMPDDPDVCGEVPLSECVPHGSYMHGDPILV